MCHGIASFKTFGGNDRNLYREYLRVISECYRLHGCNSDRAGWVNGLDVGVSNRKLRNGVEGLCQCCGRAFGDSVVVGSQPVLCGFGIGCNARSSFSQLRIGITSQSADLVGEGVDATVVGGNDVNVVDVGCGDLPIGHAGGNSDGILEQPKVVNVESVVGQRASSGGLAGIRGVNYARNQASRDKKKRRKNEVAADAALKSHAQSERILPVGELKSYWSDVLSADAQLDLKRTRAEMMRSQNLLRAQLAKDALARIDEEKNTGLYERRHEAERLRVEAKLVSIGQGRGVISPGRSAGRTVGWAATVVSNGSVQSDGVVPSLSNGSVSPNSSISVEALAKMERKMQSLELANASLLKEVKDKKDEIVRREKVWQDGDDDGWGGFRSRR